VNGQNATTLQVAIGALAGIKWAIDNPNKGVCFPEDLPYKEILDICYPYLGTWISTPVHWSPINTNQPVLQQENLLQPVDMPNHNPVDPLQFSSFIINMGTKNQFKEVTKFDDLENEEIKNILGEGPFRCLNKNIEVRYSQIQGHGLFTREKILAGTIIYADTGQFSYPVYSSNQLDELFTEEKKKFFYHYCMQIGIDLYIGPENDEQLSQDFSFYLNHSCSPTAIIWNDNEWIARRDIEKDEEITADYCTFTLDHMVFQKCNCGTSDCRGIIREDDYMNPRLIKKYWPYFNSHVKDKIDKMK